MASRRTKAGTKARAATLGVIAVLALGAGSAFAAPHALQSGIRNLDVIQDAQDGISDPVLEPSATPEPTDSPDTSTTPEPTDTPEATSSPEASEPVDLGDNSDNQGDQAEPTHSPEPTDSPDQGGSGGYGSGHDGGSSSGGDSGGSSGSGG